MVLQALLEKGRVEEALDLAETCQHKGQQNDRFQAVLNLVRQRAAFIYFQKMELDRARELFIRGKACCAFTLTLEVGNIVRNCETKLRSILAKSCRCTRV